MLICKALGDVNRLHIVEQLTRGELCACKILEKLQITQPTLSHHMKILCESGVVACRRQGKWSYYSIDAEKLEQAAAYLERMAVAAKAASVTEE